MSVLMQSRAMARRPDARSESRSRAPWPGSTAFVHRSQFPSVSDGSRATWHRVTTLWEADEDYDG